MTVVMSYANVHYSTLYKSVFHNRNIEVYDVYTGKRVIA